MQVKRIGIKSARKGRLVVGITLVLLVTGVLAGAVATSAAITVELADGDTCETGGTSYVKPTPTTENVRTLAGNVTDCIVEDSNENAVIEGPPTGTG